MAYQFSDQRVKLSATGLYTYLDVVALCGELQLEGDTLLNPQLLLKVLSDPLRLTTGGGKFAHYRRIEAVQDYVLVAQEQLMVDHHLCQHEERSRVRLRPFGSLTHKLLSFAGIVAWTL